MRDRVQIHHNIQGLSLKKAMETETSINTITRQLIIILVGVVLMGLWVEDSVRRVHFSDFS